MIKKRNKLTTLLIILIIIAIVGTVFTGCKKPAEVAKPNTTPNATFAYPMKTDVKITYWMGLHPNLSVLVKSFGESEIGKELTKKTGINVEWIHPAQGQEVDQFNLLLASGDLPDIIETGWSTFPGGPEKAINDGYIMKLNEVMDKWGPNLKAKLASNGEWNKMAKTDSGSYYQFPFIRGDASLMVFHGPIFRKDMLDEVGLPVPETIDDWTKTLTAFKEMKGSTAAFSYLPGFLDLGAAISGAYGVRQGLNLQDGKVVYGETQPAYKDYVTQLRKWYADGLLDKNVASIDQKTIDANIVSGKTGATVGYTGSSIGKWMPLLKAANPKFDLVAAPYPVLKKGDKPEYGQKDLALPGNGAAITKTSKNQEIAARFLDYGYTKEGEMLFNFGIEDVSYNMVNNYPTYTDLILKNPDKTMSPSIIMTKYIRGNYGGIFMQRKEYMVQYVNLPQQQNAIKVWANTNVDKHLMPRVTLTPEESASAAKIQTDVNTYNSEMFMKFIMGVEPMENWDKYVAQLKKLNVDKLVEINQAAVERYNKR